MPLEVPANDLISELNELWPLEGDLLAEQNEHTQTIKRVMKNSLPNNSGVATFDAVFTFDGVNLRQEYTEDAGTLTVTRKGTLTRLSRETATAVVWTMGAFATEQWVVGDIVIGYLGPGIDVQVLRAGTGLFTLPDGTTTTSLEATTDGKLELLYTGSDNWRLLRQ